MHIYDIQLLRFCPKPTPLYLPIQNILLNANPSYSFFSKKPEDQQNIAFEK